MPGSFPTRCILEGCLTSYSKCISFDTSVLVLDGVELRYAYNYLIVYICPFQAFCGRLSEFKAFRQMLKVVPARIPRNIKEAVREHVRN